jgi:hypothetical protein
MNETDVIEGNKLIAEFVVPNWRNLGEDKFDSLDEFNSLLVAVSMVSNQYDLLNYHSNWNQLMSVVEMIEEMGYSTSFKTRVLRINPRGGNYDEVVAQLVMRPDGWYLRRYVDDDGDDCDRLPIARGEGTFTKIEATWMVVVEFLKWYNKQK